jgi:putative membrane protein
MKLRTILFACALGTGSIALAGPTTTDTTTDHAKLADVDAQVVAHLHAVDLLEIDLGKLAQKNGTAPVKQYGQMLVKDHTAFDAKLVAFANKHAMPTIPADDTQSPTDKTDMDAEKGKLATLRGTAFDQELLPMMKMAHDQELTKLDANAAMVADSDLKTMLVALKPTLQKHSDQAAKLQSPALRSSTPTN